VIHHNEVMDARYSKRSDELSREGSRKFCSNKAKEREAMSGKVDVQTRAGENSTHQGPRPTEYFRTE
jgi:hypothetical protein